MLWKRLFNNPTNPQKNEVKRLNCDDTRPLVDEPQTVYEHIALGNALEEAEARARGKWNR